MHGWSRIAIVVAAITLCSGGALASANTPPLADAGLDQTVPNGTTVYLDAGGSVDPDGSITNATWSITGPNGTTVNSTCGNCTRTQFTPTRTGEYTATASVTDDDGATRNDTLSVTVEPTNGPSVTLTGPGRTRPDQTATFTVTATAGNADLRQLHWFRNGSRQRSIDLAGRNSTVTLNRSFSETKIHQLTTIVRDTNGYSQTSSMDLRVGSRDGSGGGYDHCPGDGNPYFVNGDFIGCQNGGADMVFEDRVLQSNDKPGLWLYNDDDELVQMVDEGRLGEMKKDPSVPLTREEVGENYEENVENKRREVFLDSIPREHGSSFGSRSSDNSHTSGGSSSSVGITTEGSNCLAPCGHDSNPY